MHSMKIFLCFLLLLGSSTIALDDDKTTWIDPGDMAGTDLTSFTKSSKNDQYQQQKIQPDVEKDHTKNGVKFHATVAKTCDLPHFKQLARIIIESFGTPGKRYASIELSEDDLKMLQEFKDNDSEGERISDVFEVIIGIFNGMQRNEILELTIFTRFLSTVEYNKEIFGLLVIISALVSILLLFETRTTMSWYRQCWYIFGFLFMISIPWEWFRLYRKEFAIKQAELIKKIPNQCTPKNMTITERMSLWMAGLLSWSEDGCVKYQEAILVDPMWEVSPSLAFSTTATRLVFKPLEYTADSFGKSLRAFLSQIPGAWQPVMIALITAIILLCILLLTKSRIKIGFFEIGPGVIHARKLEREDINALKDTILQGIRDVVLRELAPRRVRNLEEMPGIGVAVQEERADGHTPSGVRETESSVKDIQ